MSRVIVEHLKKHFGSITALADITFSLAAGDALGVVGANGAGKSTLLNCLAGIQRLDGGTIETPDSVKIGYLGHQLFLYSELSVEENLIFWARIAGVAEPKMAADVLIKAGGLDGRREDRVRTLSAGMQKRVSLCRAMVNKPQLLLLDEPYSAFDEAGRRFLQQAITEIHEGGGIVVMATHYVARAMDDCSHIAVLEGGRIEQMERAERIDITALGKRLAEVQR